MLVLAATGLGAIDLDDQAEGYIAESWSLGPPQVRDVVENRTLANGTIDWTSFVGARALVMTVSCFPTATRTVQGQIDRLAAFCRPDLRPTLTWGFDTDAERMVVMRANPGLDVEFSTNSYRWRRVGLSFIVPDSMQWGITDEVSHVYPTGGAEVGRTYYEAETPVNLLTTATADAEVDASGWTAVNATKSWHQGGAASGTGYVRGTATGSANVYLGASGLATAQPAVSEGETYTIMSSVRSPSAGCLVGYVFYDAAGAAIGATNWGTAVPTTPGQWSAVRRIVTAPTDAAFLAFQIHPSPGIVTTGQAVDVDRAGIFAGDVGIWTAPGSPQTWGRRYNRTYPASSGPANVTVINPGQIAVPWVARIHGPCVNPALYNDTVGDGLLLTANGGLTLGAGDYVTLDSAARTITVDGANRYDRLDIAKSRWWSLAPGDNRIRFQPSQFSEGSSAEITWRSAWL